MDGIVAGEQEIKKAQSQVLKANKNSWEFIEIYENHSHIYIRENSLYDQPKTISKLKTLSADFFVKSKGKL